MNCTVKIDVPDVDAVFKRLDAATKAAQTLLALLDELRRPLIVVRAPREAHLSQVQVVVYEDAATHAATCCVHLRGAIVASGLPVAQATALATELLDLLSTGVRVDGLNLEVAPEQAMAKADPTPEPSREDRARAVLRELHSGTDADLNRCLNLACDRIAKSGLDDALRWVNDVSHTNPAVVAVWEKIRTALLGAGIAEVA